MKKQGFSITSVFVFVGLLALIVWGLNYIINNDFVVLRTPVATVSNSDIATTSTPTDTQTASSTATTTLAQTIATSTVATSTPVKTQVTSSTIATSSALTVTLTNKGFSPASLTVKKGQAVTFVNNSSGQMWVAANPFPTSSEYPAFNEKSGVDSGKSWSFTFDKTGTWFYHNHFSPAQGAKIVVNAK